MKLITSSVCSEDNEHVVVKFKDEIKRKRVNDMVGLKSKLHSQQSKDNFHTKHSYNFYRDSCEYRFSFRQETDFLRQMYNTMRLERERGLRILQ